MSAERDLLVTEFLDADADLAFHVAKAKDILNTMANAVSAMKIFPSEHDTVKAFLDSLSGKFDAFFERYPRLEVGVGEYAFSCADRIVYSDEMTIKSLPLLLLQRRDGDSLLLPGPRSAGGRRIPRADQIHLPEAGRGQRHRRRSLGERFLQHPVLRSGRVPGEPDPGREEGCAGRREPARAPLRPGPRVRRGQDRADEAQGGADRTEAGRPGEARPGPRKRGPGPRQDRPGPAAPGRASPGVGFRRIRGRLACPGVQRRPSLGGRARSDRHDGQGQSRPLA